MLGSESLILAQRTMCLGRLFEDYASNWIAFFSFYTYEKVGGKLILQCHFDCRNLPVSKPGFYEECLDAWFTLTGKENVLVKT